VMTYSKSRSLAGARLGFAIANEALIADLNRMKYSTNPYSINRLTLRAGTAAIRDQAYYDANCAKIAEIRERAKQELKRQGFFCTDSKSNFLFAKHPAVSGETLYRELKEKGILVRHFTKDRIKEFIRITVGTEAQMEALYAVLRRILSEKTGGTTR
jgi:histidinol-phosphate transaminase